MGRLRYETSAKNGIHNLRAQSPHQGNRATLERKKIRQRDRADRPGPSTLAFSGRNLDGLQGRFLLE